MNEPSKWIATIGNADNIADNTFIIKLFNQSNKTQLVMLMRKAPHNEFYIIDCDERTQKRLKRFQKHD